MKASGLDALLGRWPAVEPQEKGGASWDDRAEAIVAAAIARKDQAPSEVIDKLVAPPALDAEPGEEKAQSFQFPETEKRETAGATQPMSDQGKKPSLKELAARASQAGAARGSIPPGARASTPPPSAVGPAARISSIPGTGATVTPITRSASPSATSTPPPVSARPKPARGSEPGREDSGILRLADIQAEEAAKAEAAAAAAEAAVAAAKQQSEKPAASRSPTVAAVPAPPSSSNKTGMWAGVAIAVMGVAAAFAVYRSRQPAETVPSKPETVAAAPQTAKPEAPAAAETAKPAAQEQPAAVASSDAAPAQSGAPKASDSAQGTAAATATATAVAEVKPSAPASPDPKGSKVGTLDEEMKKAVGANESQPAPQDDSKPAAGGGGALPDVPSQGNAQAAVRAVLPGARACVAGATDTSSASVTFSSSGSVSSVSVGGWAAQNGKSGCVQSALKGAHVAPFAKPSFTVPVTIRP